MADTRKATKTDLRQEIAELRHVGSQMSNLCFNLGQHEAQPSTLLPEHKRLMRACQRDWDKIKRSEVSNG